MHSLRSSERIESTLYPGVLFVLKKMTEGRRIALRLLTKDVQARCTELVQQMQALGKVTEKSDPKIVDELLQLVNQHQEVMANEMYPLWVQWGLQTIEGLEIDGAPVTSADEFLQLAPSELYDEARKAIERCAGLGDSGEEQQKNSVSPITSNAVEDGRTPATTAPFASETVTTVFATAASTSPAT